MKSFFRGYIKPFWPIYLALFLCAITLFVNVCYLDFYATMRHSLTLLSSLFTGQIREFYNLCANGMPGGLAGSDVYSFNVGAFYDITLYVIFALWNIPLYLFETLSGMNSQNYMLCVWYSKLLLVFFLFLSAYFLIRIAEKLEVSEKNRQLLLLSYLSSLLVLHYTIASANYDIIELTFALGGIDALLENKSRKFLVFFALANSIKYFAFCLFIPLIIIKNSKIQGFIKDLVLGSSLVALSKTVFFGAASTSQHTDFINVLISSNLWISPYVLLYCGICVFALCWHFKYDLLTKKRCVYLCSLAMVGFISFGVSFAYWSVLSVPFLLFLVFMDKQHSKLLFICMIAFQFSMLISKQIQYPYVYDGLSFINLPLWRVFGQNIAIVNQTYESGFAIGSVWQLIAGSGIHIKLIFVTLYMFCFGCLAYLRYPKEKSEQRFEDRLGNVTYRNVEISSYAMILYAVLLELIYLVQAIRKG